MLVYECGDERNDVLYTCGGHPAGIGVQDNGRKEVESNRDLATKSHRRKVLRNLQVLGSCIQTVNFN